jgi:8-amino-7-oxononanoate synthase
MVMKRSIQSELDEIRSQGLFRSTRLITGRQSKKIILDGREVLLLCSNNYLGLAEHPALAEASKRAIDRYGVSSGASRLVSGTMELHEQLEKSVTSFKKSEAALIFNSGHAANTGIIPALVGRGDAVFSDRLNHASIVDGIRLSGARLFRYSHNDHQQLADLLERQGNYGRSLIVTDGVFSMDGDLAPLKELAALKRRYDALLMVDDAHGSGVLGPQGRGSSELLGVADDIDIKMGTFGKALGSFGAYAAVSAEIRELLINRSRSFIFSTSLPPSVLAASLAALEIVQSPEGDLLREQLHANAAAFRKGLNELGYSVPEGSTQIIPVITGDTDTTMIFSASLLEEGIFAQGIRPPTVPVGSCRIRFTIMATHRQDDLEMALAIIGKVGMRLGVV